MSSFQRQTPAPRTSSVNAARGAGNGCDRGHPIHPILRLQSSLGNQTVQRLLAGGDAPMPLRPLTAEDRRVDLQADRFRDDERLQAAFDDNPPLRASATGPAVEKLQQAFLDLGFAMPKSTRSNGKPDGIFGHETVLVVKGFQWSKGIVQDGVVGRQTLGELDGLFSGQTPPGTRPAGPDQPGAAISVSEKELDPKRFGTCGGFTWKVDWETNARNGYLVQEITHDYVIDKCEGKAPPDVPVTPRYWETWRVQEDGGIHGTSGSDDEWINPSLDLANPLAGFPGTKGQWTTTGRVHFVNQLDPKAGFKVANVPDAGSLWSTTTQPGNLGQELLLRRAGARWNCCGDESNSSQKAEEGDSGRPVS